MTPLTVPTTFVLQDWMHHGDGSAGNTSLLRCQDIALPDGRHASVPYVSGNSFRHCLRDALAWDIAARLGLGGAGPALSKGAADLLWSGGALTRTGAETDLDLIRRVERTAPWLILLGYSAGSHMQAGTLTVDNIHLVCEENAWRLPARLAGSPHATQPAGTYRGEEFGTRHDVAGGPVARLLAETDPDAVPTSTQMIYDVQAVRPGAVMWGAVHLTAAATRQHHQVLAVALDLAAPHSDGARRTRLGAKAGTGYGACLLDVDLADLDPDGTAANWWADHINTHADDIVALVAELVG